MNIYIELTTYTVGNKSGNKSGNNWRTEPLAIQFRELVILDFIPEIIPTLYEYVESGLNRIYETLRDW